MAFQQIIVVDVTHPKNRNPFFRPLRRVMKSEVRASQFTNDVPGALMSIGGTIPGERMTVDFKSHTWKVAHRLSLKENKELADRIRKIRATDERMPENVTFGDEETGTFSSDEDQVATWLYHLRALVDQKYLTLITGNLPTAEEILKMGRVQSSTPAQGIPDKIADRACFIPKADDKPAASVK